MYTHLIKTCLHIFSNMRKTQTIKKRKKYACINSNYAQSYTKGARIGAFTVGNPLAGLHVPK